MLSVEKKQCIGFSSRVAGAAVPAPLNPVMGAGFARQSLSYQACGCLQMLYQSFRSHNLTMS